MKTTVLLFIGALICFCISSWLDDGKIFLRNTLRNIFFGIGLFLVYYAISDIFDKEISKNESLRVDILLTTH